MRTLSGMIVILLAAIASPMAAQTTPVGDSTRTIAVRAARLIDGRGGAPVENPVVLIKGDRIAAVGPDLAIPPGTKVIDLKGATLLPGLIDCHTHITGGDPDDYYESIFRRSPIDYAVRAPVFARRTLEAGFTTVRDVGSGEFIDVALRNAINDGTVIGPRMQVATLAVGAWLAGAALRRRNLLKSAVLACGAALALMPPLLLQIQRLEGWPHIPEFAAMVRDARLRRAPHHEG